MDARSVTEMREILSVRLSPRTIGGAAGGVARRVQMELAIAMGVIVVAAVLVAQVPGRA